MLLIILLATTAISCSSEDSPSAVIAAVTNGFTWIDDNGTTIQTVDNPYATNQYKSIFAVRSGATIYEINLTSIAVGTYSLTASGNALYYRNTTMTAPFSATSGNVIITANGNNKLSGTFAATGTGGGVTSVAGQFKDIVVNP